MDDCLLINLMAARNCTFIYCRRVDLWRNSFLLLLEVNYEYYLKNSGLAEVDGITNELEIELADKAKIRKNFELDHKFLANSRMHSNFPKFSEILQEILKSML